MKRNLRDMIRKTNGNMEPSQEQVEGLMNQAKKYEGKSEAELLGELVSKYKQGALRDEDLDRFVNQSGPMLSPDQRQKLQSIIQRIRS
ncbi:MAG: hypothetical protein ACOYIR_01570 [Christensenellales bacterium]